MKDIVWLSGNVVEQLLEEREKRFDLETGGLLLGYLVEENTERNWVITAVSTPGPDADYARHHYEPDYSYDKQVAVEHFRNTTKTEYYLGDWHTHPKGSTHISWSDRSTLYRNAKRATATDQNSLMLIIGGALANPEWAVYKGTWAMMPWSRRNVRADICFSD